MEYSFDTLCRLLARAALSESDDQVLILALGVVVNGSAIVDDEADEETEVDIITDMTEKDFAWWLRGGVARGEGRRNVRGILKRARETQGRWEFQPQRIISLVEV